MSRSLTIDQHRALGVRIQGIKAELGSIAGQLTEAYPRTDALARNAAQAQGHVDVLVDVLIDQAEGERLARARTAADADQRLQLAGEEVPARQAEPLGVTFYKGATVKATFKAQA